MKKTLTAVVLLLLVIILAGCYEVEMRVRVFETGEGLLTHAVKLPTIAYNMRLSALQTDTATLKKELRESTLADAAPIDGLQVAGVAVIADGDKTVINRQLLFADGRALSAYLDLLGLNAQLQRKTTLFCKRTKGFEFSLQADKIETEKIVRLGRYYEDSPSGLGNRQMPMKMSQGSLEIAVELPGELKAIAPDTRRENGGYRWTLPGDQYEQPLDLRLAGKLAKVKPLAMDEQPLGKPFTAKLVGDSDPAEYEAFARRLDERFIPLLHARVDKKGRVDLALLWLTDDISAGYTAYHRRIDDLLLPELHTNYFSWMELCALDGENRLAAGYRSRRPFPTERLVGMLAVAKDGTAATFFTPRVESIAGDGERVAMIVKVTFADGRTAQAQVYAKDLANGAPIVLKP